MRHVFLAWNPVAAVPIHDFIIDDIPIKLKLVDASNNDKKPIEKLYDKVTEVEFVRQRSGLFILSLQSVVPLESWQLLDIASKICDYIMQSYFGHSHCMHSYPPKSAADITLQISPIEIDLDQKYEEKNSQKELEVKELKELDSRNLLKAVKHLKAKNFSKNKLKTQYALLAIRAKHSKLGERCQSAYQAKKSKEVFARWISIAVVILLTFFITFFVPRDVAINFSFINFKLQIPYFKPILLILVWSVFETTTIKVHLHTEELLQKFKGFVNGLKPYSILAENIYNNSNMSAWEKERLYNTVSTGSYDALVAKVSDLLEAEQNNASKHASLITIRLSAAAIGVAILQFAPKV